MRQFYFEKLEVWQDARSLVKDVYALCERFPVEEKYGMTAQLKRAAVGIVLNIAEGMSRRTEKDKARFINQAFSSAIEVIGILVLSHDLAYIDEEAYIAYREKTEKVTNKLNSLYNKFDN